MGIFLLRLHSSHHRKLQFPFLLGEPKPAVDPAQTIVVRAIFHSSRHVPYLWGNMHSRARPTPSPAAIADGLAACILYSPC